jgi:hypothetical protein
VTRDKIIQIAIHSGSQEAFTSSGVRRDLSFNSAELVAFATALIEAERHADTSDSGSSTKGSEVISLPGMARHSP